MSKEFMADIPKEGETIEQALSGITTPEKDEQEKTTPASSPEEQSQATDAPSSQGASDEKKDDQQSSSTNTESEQQTDKSASDERFDKRWRERENKFKELIESRDHEIEELKKTIEEKFAALQQSRTPEEIPAWFQRIYGRDQAAWEEYTSYEATRISKIKEELKKEQEAATSQAKKEEEKWEKWVESEITKLKDEGLTFDRDKLLKVAVEYMPSDVNGNIDMRKAYDIMQKLDGAKPASTATATKKQIADTTIAQSSSSSQKKPEYQTPASLRNTSWGSILNDN